MKKKCLYIGIIICAMVVIAIYSISLCGDDKGFRVVEIGKIDGIPISGPMKWAPSSDKIAFISNSNLVVADTLGKKIAEFSTEFTPRRFEWLSDKEIVYFERLMSKSIAQIRLIRCDISTGQSTIIEEFKTKKPLARGINEGEFEGPYLTIQGNLYYFMYRSGNKIPTIPQSRFFEIAKYEENYIYRQNANGLYLLRTDLKDSVYAFESGYADTVKSLKQKYIVRDGLLTNIIDSTAIFLDTFPFVREIKQKYQACSFSGEQINPARPELLFSYYCDIDEYNSADYLFLLDMNSNICVDLPKKVNEEYCQEGQFSPDGRLIAMYCSGKGYILIREEI